MVYLRHAMNERIANALALGDLIEFFSPVFGEASRVRPPTLLVHSSLSSFGRVDGGAETVVAALSECARRERFTLVMPWHSNGDARVNGRIAASFGSRLGTVRSAHPELAFAGRGPLARKILGSHRREYGLGEQSPVGKLYGADASVLMLGTGYGTCTVMHLAEYRLAEEADKRGRPVDRVTCSWRKKTWADIAYRTELFPGLGEAFELAAPNRVARGPMPGADDGAAAGATPGYAPEGASREWRLVGVRALVDFCVDTSGYLG